MNVSRRPKPEVRQIELATSGDSRAAAGLLQLEHFIYGEESVQEADPLLSQNTKIPGGRIAHWTGLGSGPIERRRHPPRAPKLLATLR